MSETLSQEQVDEMISQYLPSYSVPVNFAQPICPKCRTFTKRMQFRGNFPMPVRVFDAQGSMPMTGNIPANSIFCFGCGSFFDLVDRSKSFK